MSDVYSSYLKLRDQYVGSDGAATAEDMLNILILVSMGAIYTNDRTSYDQLQASNNIAGKAITLDSISQILALAGATSAVLRVAIHRFFKDRPIVELIYGLSMWTIFLIVIIVSAGNNNTINDALKATPIPTPAPGSNLQSQHAILNLALSSSTSELNWAILGFVFTTLYTIMNVFRLIYATPSLPQQ